MSDETPDAFDIEMGRQAWLKRPSAKFALEEVAAICDAVIVYMVERNISDNTRDILTMTDMVLTQANYREALEGDKT